jgi:hypothetical protein
MQLRAGEIATVFPSPEASLDAFCGELHRERPYFSPAVGQLTLRICCSGPSMSLRKLAQPCT